MNRKIAKTLLKPFGFLFEWRWEFGFIENSLQDVVDGANLIIRWTHINLANRWFADPFILEYDKDTISILAEEKRDHHIGRIALLEFDRNTLNLNFYKILLDKVTHMSFPVIRRIDGRVYVMPENSEAGVLELYLYDNISKSLNKVQTLCNEGLVDAVPFEIDGNQLLFATKEPNPNDKELLVYELKGYEYVYKESLQYSDKRARMAGDFFCVNGKTYRPTQDCNRTYGGAVVIEEFNYGKAGFLHKEVRKIESPHPVMNNGLHTFNHYKDLIVIDVKGFKYPRFVRFAQWIKSYIKIM